MTSSLNSWNDSRHGRTSRGGSFHEPTMKKLTASNYRKDKLYPPVARAVAEILKTERVVSPVGVLLQMQRLTKQQLED
jgi:hypothetical protein